MQYSSSQNTVSNSDDLEPSNEELESDFTYLETYNMHSGDNSIEISVLSNVERFDPKFISKANVEIKRITFLGTTNGGAGDCIPVPAGWFAPKLSTMP